MWNLLCQYNNRYASSYKYLKEKKSTNWRLKKKATATIATIQNKTKQKRDKDSINQSGTVEALALFI